MLAVAHRGYSARFPENSRAAYEAAIAAGADYIESDARLTADGEVVSCHDADFARISGTSLVTAETRMRDLAGLDIGDGQPPLRLSDVLELAAGRVNLLIDVKTDGADLAHAVLDRVLAADAIASTVIGLRSPRQIELILRREPRAGCLGFVPDCEDIPTFLEAGAVAVRAWEGDIRHAAVQNALHNGTRIWVTAGLRSDGEAPGYITAERLLRLKDHGFEAVLLNDPTLITGQNPGDAK